MKIARLEIAGTGLERDLTEGDAAACGEIDGFIILDGPACGDELFVDLLAGDSFGGHAGGASRSGTRLQGKQSRLPGFR